MPRQRGSQVSVAHADGAYAIVQALIARGVIGDFRAPDILRFGFTPLYTRFVDVWDAVDRLAQVLESGEWRDERFRVRAAVHQLSAAAAANSARAAANSGDAGSARSSTTSKWLRPGTSSDVHGIASLASRAANARLWRLNSAVSISPHATTAGQNRRARRQQIHRGGGRVVQAERVVDRRADQRRDVVDAGHRHDAAERRRGHASAHAAARYAPAELPAATMWPASKPSLSARQCSHRTAARHSLTMSGRRAAGASL